MGPAGSRAKCRATLDELLDTLRLLEEEPEPLPLPHPRAYHKDKYAWTDEVTAGAALDPALGTSIIPSGREAHWAPSCFLGTLTRIRWGLLNPQASRASLRLRTLRLTPVGVGTRSASARATPRRSELPEGPSPLPAPRSWQPPQGPWLPDFPQCCAPPPRRTTPAP